MNIRRDVICALMLLVAVGTVQAKTTHLESGQAPYLPDNWDKVAARYGHQYVYLAQDQDNSPQVITSKHPIRNMKRIAGGQDTIVGHGAGWVQIDMDGKTYNIVCMHAMPFSMGGSRSQRGMGFGRPGGGGSDEFRKKEVQYVCNQTILTREHREQGAQYWVPSDHRPILIKF